MSEDRRRPDVSQPRELPDPYRLARVVTDGTVSQGVVAQCRAVNLGFHMPWPDDDFLNHFAQHVAGERLWAVQGPEDDAELPGLPVATLASYDQTINSGHGHLEPADFITDVTVRPTHRRRGLLRGLISHDLAAARRAGLSMAALTATEGAIYGRFGFGVSTQNQRIEVTSGGRFVLSHRPEGSVEMVAPGKIDELRLELFRRFHASRRGSHGRLDWWVEFASGRWSYEKQKPDRRVRSAIHRDPQGRPDGVVSYQVTEDFGSTLEVHDLIAVTADAELGLWEFLASIDLVTKITAGNTNPDTPLPWAVRDPRLVRFTGRSDLTWVRILDVVKALSVRGWDHTGSVVLRVTDPLEWCTGSYRIEVSDPERPAVVTRVADDAAGTEGHATIGIAALGSLYFGAVRAQSLAGAGHLRGSAEQIQTIGRMFATDDLPFSITEF